MTDFVKYVLSDHEWNVEDMEVLPSGAVRAILSHDNFFEDGDPGKIEFLYDGSDNDFLFELSIYSMYEGESESNEEYEESLWLKAEEIMRAFGRTPEESKILVQFAEEEFDHIAGELEHYAELIFGDFNKLEQEENFPDLRTCLEILENKVSEEFFGR